MFGEISAQKSRALRGTDYLIQQRRREEFSRKVMLEQKQYYTTTNLKSQFEQSSEQSIKRNAVKRYIKLMSKKEAESLEQRRQKLKNLYDRELEQWRQELETISISKEDRLESMKARVAKLREKREEERKKIVEEKLFQQWRNNCDELRTLESKAMEKDVAKGRQLQVHEKELEKLSLEDQNKYYDDLWEKERLKKVDREEREMEERRKLNLETVKTLDQQTIQLKEKIEREEILKKEEAALMLQQVETERIKEQRLIRQKQEEQKQIRLELDTFNKMRLAQRAKEVQEALDDDIRIVNEFSKMEEHEKQEKNRRKEELRKELQSYREYLLGQQKEEKERQKEIGRIFRQEEEKVWRQRAERWSKELQARNKLMSEVIATRQEQLRYKVEKNRQEQDEARREKEELMRQIAAIKLQEKEETEKRRQENEIYRSSLRHQIESVTQRRQEQYDSEKRESENEKAVTEKYEKWLSDELSKPIVLRKSYGIKSYISKAK